MMNLLPTAVLYIARQRELETEASIERRLQMARAAARQETPRRMPGRDTTARGKGPAAAPQRAGA